MMPQLPDFDSMPIAELLAWAAAIRAGIAALDALGAGELAIIHDADGVSVVITIDGQEKT